MIYGPDPSAIYPNQSVKSVCYIKNIITRPNISVGEYTYYDNPENPEDFENHVTHHYEFLGDRLIIGRFCAIARGIEFVMNGANHRMSSVTTYPFNIMGSGREKCTPTPHELPFKGDTVVGNDVWIGQPKKHLRIWKPCVAGIWTIFVGLTKYEQFLEQPQSGASNNQCRFYNLQRKYLLTALLLCATI